MTTIWHKKRVAIFAVLMIAICAAISILGEILGWPPIVVNIIIFVVGFISAPVFHNFFPMWRFE